jgi:hypothetical protein
VLGIILTVVIVAADELLQYLPQGYASLLSLGALPPWRLLFGNALGVLAIPLSVIGYWQICQALKLSGIKRTSLMFWLIAYGAALGAVGHAGITATIVLLQQSDTLIKAFGYLVAYVAVPFGLFLFCYLILSVWFCIVVLSRSTLYPKWMALLNPFLLTLAIALLGMSKVLPSFASVLSPAWFSFPQLVFFTCSTLVLWNLSEERVQKTVLAKPNQ